MAEWPKIMEGNIAHTLIDRNIFNGCYDSDLQRRIVLLLRHRVITNKMLSYRRETALQGAL